MGVTYTSKVRRYVRAIHSLGTGGTRRTCLGNLRGGVHTIRRHSVLGRFNLTIFIISTSLILGLNVTAITLIKIILLVRKDLSILAFFVFLLMMSHLCSPLRNTLRGLTTIVDAQAGVTHVGRVLSRPVRRNDSELSGRKCSVIFSRIKFTCGAKRAMLGSISFATGRKRIATLINPSNNKGAAMSQLTTEF